MKYLACTLLLLTACNFADQKRMVHLVCFDLSGKVNLDEVRKVEAIDVNTIADGHTCVFTIMDDNYYGFLSP